MTNYREILRLAEMGMSRTSIGATLGYSRNTVADVLQRAHLHGANYPLPDSMGDRELRDKLYPERNTEQNRKIPDYEKVHKELGKRGVTMTLLWDEYCNECRENGEIPYGHTQFNYHYHQYAQANKATMHLTHKPGERLEVDW